MLSTLINLVLAVSLALLSVFSAETSVKYAKRVVASLTKSDDNPNK